MTRAHRALASLIADLVARKEIQALKEMPYEKDPDLASVAPSGPPLPYDGEIPAEVEERARIRRR